MTEGIQPVQEAVQWDPAAAYDAHTKAEADASQAEEYSKTIERMPSMAETIVKVGMDPDARRISAAEYVGWLRGQAETGRAQVIAYGGPAAVEAYQATLEQAAADEA